MARGSLGSEWFGFDGNEFYPPKSFGLDSDPDWNGAYRALFYLIGGIDKTKNATPGDLAETSKQSKSFLEYILLKNVIAASAKLSNTYRPSYLLHGEIEPKIRGKINFTKTASKCFGLRTHHFCEYYDLKQEDPILSVIKEGALKCARVLSPLINSENRKLLFAAANFIQSVSGSNSDSSLIRLYCHQILSDGYTNEKFGDLITEAKVLAYFLLFNQIGYESASSAKKVILDGVLVNLNRTFEKFISSALLATGRFEKDSNDLNRILLREEGSLKASGFIMRPDCKGYLTLNSGRSYLLLDVKHKVMRNILEEDASKTESDINRNDFYQIISYAKTMRKRSISTVDSTFVLFGLNYENGSEAELVSALPTIFIDDEQHGLNVDRICLNFGLAMKMLGNALESDEGKRQIFSKVGLEIIKCIEQCQISRKVA